MSTIYLVTTQQELFDNDVYKIIGVEESLRLLAPLKIVGIDTETKGISPHTGTLLSLQLGNREFQIVIDCITVPITLYKEYLESDRLFLFWNAKFDLKWLFKYKIVPKRVYDGFLAEKLLWNGYPIVLTPEIWERIREPRYDLIKADSKSKNSKDYYMLKMSLKKAGELYLGIELDKTVRGQIIWRGLDSQVIEYAALDVKYLEDIREKQLAELSKKELLTAIEYENRFILPLAYMEFCGVKIDVEKWKSKMLQDNERLKLIVEQMNNWLIQNEPDSKYIYVNLQGSLFDGFDTSPKVKINWNSAKQIIPIFKKYGVNVEIEDKDKGGNKDSINEKVIAPQKDKCSLIPLYLEYKRLMKLTTTYGQNFIDQINKDTGRLYTNFNPVGTDTAKTCSNICLIQKLFVNLYY